MALTEATNDLLPSVWERIAPELMRMICAMGVGEGHRDDVLQDVYLAAWKDCPIESDSDGLRRWLFRVAVNRCRLEHRRRSRWRAAWEGLASRLSWQCDREEDAPDPVETDETRRLVRRALAALTPDARALLVLRYFMEFDSTEIGRIMERPSSTIRDKLRGARRQLASELKRTGYRHE